MTHYPEVTAALLDRVSERSLRLATTQAISQLTGVDRRLKALLWHLAERWGRVSSDGVIVPLALTHRILGQLVGARRPTVSSALAELVTCGELTRRPDGSWLLTGDTPDARSFARHPAAATAPHGTGATNTRTRNSSSSRAPPARSPRRPRGGSWSRSPTASTRLRRRLRCEQPSRDLPPLGFRGVKARRFAARVVADVRTAVVAGVKVHVRIGVVLRPQRLGHAGEQAGDA